MKPEEFRHIDSVFSHARGLPVAHRAAYLDEACRDATARELVDELLQNDAQPHAMLRADITAAAIEGLAGVDAAATGSPPERIGRYRVIDVLGVGGMGVVYRAEQENPRRVVALKLVRPGAVSPQVLRRFTQEAQMLGRLQHPGIAQIFEAGTTDDGSGRHGRQPYFAMELVEGRPLLEYAKREKLGTRERVELLAMICDALKHAHGKGVVHRDLKPGNILVQSTGVVSGQPKVLDFGVARAIGADLATVTLRTDIGQLVGTVPYMSPEQIAGDPSAIDARCDVYALGVVLYQLLTDRLPHDVINKPLAEAARIIRYEEPTPLSAVDRVFRGDLDTIVAKALEKDQSRRYASAAALGADLRRYLADEPIVARRPSAIYQLRKFTRRNKAIVVGVVAVMAVLAAGLVTSTLLYLASESRAEELRRALYAHSISLAQIAYERYDGVALAERLEACPADLRHWEWNRLSYVSDRSVMTFAGHPGGVGSIAFTPDGTHLITTGSSKGLPAGEADTAVRIWDLGTGRNSVVLSAHTSPVNSVAVSADGTTIATGCWTSPGTHASPDDRIMLWDATTWEVRRTLRYRPNAVRWLHMTGDGRGLVIGEPTQSDRIDIETGAVITSYDEHRFGMQDMTLSPDDSRLASCGWEGSVIVSDTETGQPVYTIEGDDRYPTLSVAISPDGTTLATGHFEGDVRLRDLTTGVVGTVLVGDENDGVHALVFAPDGGRIIWGSENGTIRIWDPASGELVRVLCGHKRGIRDLAVSGDGRWLASGSDDGTAKLWRLETRDDVVAISAHEHEVNALAWSHTGTRVATAGDDTSYVVDVTTGEPLLEMRHERLWVYTASWSPDDTRIVTGDRFGWLRLWDSETGKRLVEWQGHTDAIWEAPFSPDGTRIATCSDDGLAKIWDASSGELVMELRGHGAQVSDVIWSPDGEHLLSADWDGRVIVWRSDTGSEVMRLAASDVRVCSIATSPDGERLVAGDEQGVVHVWDLSRRRRLLRVEAHATPCNGVAYSPDGRRLLTGAFDDTVRLFDAQTGQRMMTLEYGAGVHDVNFSPDGSWIAASSQDHSARLWPTRD